MRVLVPVLAVAQPGCRMVQEIPEAGTNGTIATMHEHCSTAGIEECEENPGCMWSTTNGTCVVGGREPLDIACGAAMAAGWDCEAQTACPVALCVTWKEAKAVCGNQTSEAPCQDQDSCIWVNAKCGVDARALVHDFEGGMRGGAEGHMVAGGDEDRYDDRRQPDPANRSHTAGGNFTGGNSTGGNSTGGNSTGGNSTGGNFTGGNSTGGNSTGGNFTGGNSTGGNFTGGNSTGGNFTGGNFTGGNFTGGNSTGGNFTGGNFTGGNQSHQAQHTGARGAAVPRQSTDPCFAMAGLNEQKCGAIDVVGLQCRYNSTVERASDLSTIRGEVEMRLGNVESGTLETLAVEDHVAVADSVGAVLQQEMLAAGWNISGQVEVSWTWELESRRLQGSTASVEIEVDYSVSVHSPVGKEDFKRVDKSRAQAGIQTALRETKGMEGAEVLEMEMEAPEEVEGDDEDEEHEEEDRDHGFGGLAMLAGCAVGAFVLGGAGVLFGRKFYCKGKPLAKADSETMGIPADADHEAGAEVKPVGTVAEPAADTGTDSKEDNKADVACDCSTASGSVPEGTQEV